MTRVAWFGEGGGQAVVSVSADDASVLDAVPAPAIWASSAGTSCWASRFADLAAAYGGDA